MDIHFHEEEIVGIIVENELDRSGSHIVDRMCCCNGLCA